MPADSRTLDDEGVVIPPTRADARTCSRDLAGRMRNPRQREADLRAQLAANRAGAERLEALLERTASTPCAPRCARRSTTRSGAPAPGSRSSRTARCTARDVLEARRGRPRAAAARHRRRRGARAGLRPARRTSTSGNLNCPLAGDPVRLLLRAARAHRPRRAAVRGRLPAADRDRARGLAPERAPARRGGRRERRDLVARGRPRARRLRPGLRPGHDEQPHARATTTSPTTRRSAAARARARTPTARARCTWRCRTR